MANLVSPGYNNSTLVGQILSPVEERIIEFKGLNKRTVVDEGEMSDMTNLSTDMYPVLRPRSPRGELNLPEGAMRPLQIIKRFDKLGAIAIDEPDDPDDPATVSFYYDGVKITDVSAHDGLPALSVNSYAVAINNIMCFFPQKTAITLTINGVQANSYRKLTVDYTMSNLAVTLSNEDAKFTLASGHGFKYDDALNIHISSYTPSGGSAKTVNHDVSCIIEQVLEDTPTEGTDTIVLPRETFIEMTGASVTDFTMTGTIKREMPDLDFIVEWNNRLWGCSSAENMIYACKLGDPSNWHYYQGTALDSYYAQQGTDEKWTGIAEYSGHLLFFKPNSITRVYGTAPSNFQITATKAFGVEDGSSKSVLTINDTVFYKSEIGIMAYQGGVPVCISDKLSWDMYNAVAGTEGHKYYCSALIKDNGETKGLLLVFDIARGMWHKEDNFRFTDACKIGEKIYCITTTKDILLCDADVFCDADLMVGTDAVDGRVEIINPDKVFKNEEEAIEDYYEEHGEYPPATWVCPETLENIPWMAVFGPFDEWLEEKKIYSKLAMRVKAHGNASCKVYISINEGDWELVANYDAVSTKGDFIPIIPRRCDRYSIKVEGTGLMEIKSLTRRVRQGSFGRL